MRDHHIRRIYGGEIQHHGSGSSTTHGWVLDWSGDNPERELDVYRNHTGVNIVIGMTDQTGTGFTFTKTHLVDFIEELITFVGEIPEDEED